MRTDVRGNPGERSRGRRSTWQPTHADRDAHHHERGTRGRDDARTRSSWRSRRTVCSVPTTTCRGRTARWHVRSRAQRQARQLRPGTDRRCARRLPAQGLGPAGRHQGSGVVGAVWPRSPVAPPQRSPRWREVTTAVILGRRRSSNAGRGPLRRPEHRVDRSVRTTCRGARRRARDPREPGAHGSHPYDPGPPRRRRLHRARHRPALRGGRHREPAGEGDATAALGARQQRTTSSPTCAPGSTSCERRVPA